MDTNLPLLPSPPEWSLDLGYAGRGLIFLAIISFAVAVAGWIFVNRNEHLRKIAARAFTLGCLSLFGAFVSLAILFIANRLEFSYVWEHGDGTNTIPYRIAGIWAGQQGSFLLWSCTSALFGVLAVRGTGILRRWFTVAYAGFLGSLASILAYESPFGLNMLNGRPVVPNSGVGLTPALQNYWVTIHPPTIFMGFGALTVLAAYAFSAILTNKPKEWAPMVRPWALVAMTLTGVGLCMGGFWAYETLGWGGFWMWDPVENVSFVPWIFSAIFVHGLMVQINRKHWTITNLFLGGMPFLLFVYGTFLTRSGVLNETSVHSFANMDNSALKLLLGFLAVSFLTFVGVWTWWAIRHGKEHANREPAPRGFHREAFFRLGAWLLAGLGFGAALGMSWPMVMALRGEKPRVVEEGLYHQTLSWLYIPLMIVMALAPLVAWRGMGVRAFAKRIYGVMCITVALVGMIMIVIGRSIWTQGLASDDVVKLPFGTHMATKYWVIFLVSLSAAVVVSNGWRISELIKRSKMSAAAFLAHVGVATLMAGLIISRGYEQKQTIDVRQGEHAVGLGYMVSYKGMTSDTFDRNNKVLFDVQNGSEKWTASPGLYYVPGDDGQEQGMVWPHIQSHPFYDIYFALHPPTTDLSDAVSLKPGETTTLNGVQITYEKMTRQGQFGQPGTKFGAMLKVTDGTNSAEVNPQIELEKGGGMLPIPVQLNRDTLLTMQGMQAGTDGVTIQMESPTPIYPIDMFYKPMTILVWLGTGILAFAGLLSAWYRRVRSTSLAAVEEAPAPEPLKKPESRGKAAPALRA